MRRPSSRPNLRPRSPLPRLRRPLHLCPRSGAVRGLSRMPWTGGSWRGETALCTRPGSTDIAKLHQLDLEELELDLRAFHWGGGQRFCRVGGKGSFRVAVELTRCVCLAPAATDAVASEPAVATENPEGDSKKAGEVPRRRRGLDLSAYKKLKGLV